MMKIEWSGKYAKDYKRITKRRYDLSHLESVIDKLAKGETLENYYRDHALKGAWAGYRECHLEWDWLLIYRINEKEQVLKLARTGTHTDLLE